MNPASHQPLFSQTPTNGFQIISVANTGRDGLGTTYTLATGGAYGTRVSYVIIKAQGTTTAGMIRLFIDEVTGGGSVCLIKEIPVTAITPSGTVESFEAIVDFEYGDSNGTVVGLVLAEDQELRVSTNNAEAFAVTCIASQYTQP
jgi:hypothetical protein